MEDEREEEPRERAPASNNKNSQTDKAASFCMNDRDSCGFDSSKVDDEKTMKTDIPLTKKQKELVARKKEKEEAKAAKEMEKKEKDDADEKAAAAAAAAAANQEPAESGKTEDSAGGTQKGRATAGEVTSPADTSPPSEEADTTPPKMVQKGDKADEKGGGGNSKGGVPLVSDMKKTRFTQSDLFRFANRNRSDFTCYHKKACFDLNRFMFYKIRPVSICKSKQVGYGIYVLIMCSFCIGS
jgi:hypothetical protein